MAYFKEAKAIWMQFVPKSGQAETVQGELLRAVEKLRDGAIRNGNGNWDQGFELLLAYLRTYLLDEAVFPTKVIAQTAAILGQLRDYENPLLKDEPYDELGDRVVEYYRHYGSQPHVADPRLLTLIGVAWSAQDRLPRLASPARLSRAEGGGGAGINGPR